MAEHRRRLKRIENPKHARYLTFSCYGRLPLFQNPVIRDVFVSQLALTRNRLGFELFAWVVMPEHVHLLLRPQADQTVTAILSALKRPVAAKVLARWREIDAKVLPRVTDNAGRAHFWQRGGGYDRNIVSVEELREKVEYIHANPVRRGLVESPGDWAWSSARNAVDGERPTIDPIPI